VVVVESLIRWN